MKNAMEYHLKMSCLLHQTLVDFYVVYSSNTSDTDCNIYHVPISILLTIVYCSLAQTLKPFP